MKVDASSKIINDEKHLSVKYITGKIPREQVLVVIRELVEHVREDNMVVNLYLYEDEKQKEYGNDYCMAEWVHQSSNHVPIMNEDLITGGNILVRWNIYHEETKKIIG